uniref:Uncharacterized protein n=1 Tax=Fagus sylvatica TaxID=28930 RepID=A0A2N9EX48_FAGSY
MVGGGAWLRESYDTDLNCTIFFLIIVAWKGEKINARLANTSLALCLHQYHNANEADLDQIYWILSSLVLAGFPIGSLMGF